MKSPLNDNDTIVALSSGSLPSGVAIVRISGSECSMICEKLLHCQLEPRRAHYLPVFVPGETAPLDRGIIVGFSGPQSFTGEDCLEFQLHGGRAVVSALLDALCAFERVRLAEAGEFSKRAFLNGRMDLTEIEGLSDLVAAETQAQRRQAFQQSQGSLRDLYEGWRHALVHIRAMIEAELDFSDEEDVPAEIAEEGIAGLGRLIDEISRHIDDANAGEIVRDGYRVALMGKPNAGKSSLLNALAKRDVAIVTEEAGTTRDVLSVNLDIGGYVVVFSDTAGIREAENIAESEGVKRARAAGKEANLVIWLQEIDDNLTVPELENGETVFVRSKDDQGMEGTELSVSAKTGYGIGALLELLLARVKNSLGGAETGLITRRRYRLALQDCLELLKEAQACSVNERDLQSEALRMAGNCLGRITGKIDVEDLLDVIFSEFCIGK